MEFPICLSDAVYLRVKIKVENRHAQDSRYTVFQESVYTYVLLRMHIIPLATSTSPDRIISCPVNLEVLLSGVFVLCVHRS